ncbi:hypothetical protein G6F68_019781 [Rhizopus microsporus]|nr:hypothetical protein G6F68_019781 [Rhizopus microsporus]
MRCATMWRAPSAAAPSACPLAAGARTCAIRVSGSRDNVPMSSPANLTDSASRFKRRPSHTGHGAPVMKRATRFFIMALCVVAHVCIT